MWPSKSQRHRSRARRHVSYQRVVELLEQRINLAAEIDVRGNGIPIASGDTTPRSADLTDFGSANPTGGTVTQTFTIVNTGSTQLALTGNPLVVITGFQSGDFTVISQPNDNRLVTNQSVTFQIRFDPSGTGIRQTNVRIDNSDSNEGIYVFRIQGTGAVPLPGQPGTPNLSSSDDTGVSNTDNITSRTSGLTFTWPVGTNATSYEYAWDVTPNNAVSGAVIDVNAPAGNGWHDFNIRSVNSAGKSGTVSLPVYIDRNGPGVSVPDLSSADDSGYLNNDNITRDQPVSLIWTAAGLIDHYEYGWNLSSLTTTTNTSVAASPPSSNGIYTFYVKAVATSGLTETKDLQITFDNSAPVSPKPTAPVGLITTLTPEFRWPYDPANDWKFLVDLQVNNGSGWEQAPGFSRPIPAERRDGLRVSQQLSFGKPYQVRIATYDIAGNVGNFGEWHSFNIAEPDIVISGNGALIADGDDTPSMSDLTAFGNVDVGKSGSPHTFVIGNTGPVDLELTGSPFQVEITGANAGDFIVVQPTGTTIAQNGSKSFEIVFAPTASGVRDAIVSIQSNDPDSESTYTFAVQGNATIPVPAPRIQVFGNGNEIANGDDTPTSTDDTDFGPVEISGGIARRTFTIKNNGTALLGLTGGIKRVQLSGDTDDFYVIGANPASPINPNGGTSTFQIEFDARATGQRSVTVTIPNTDNDNNPFVFALTGTGARSSVVSGPRVTTAGPPVKDLESGTIDHVILRFDKPIDPTTITSNILKLDRNGFNIPVTSLQKLNNQAYRGNFEPQSAPGIYRIILAPTVRASSGELLNQDGDAFNGESGDDQFVRLFEILATSPIARSATLTSPNSGSWQIGELVRIQGYSSDPAIVNFTVLELFDGGTDAVNRVGEIYRGAPGSGVKSSYDWSVPSHLEGSPIEGTQYRIGLTFMYSNGSSSTTYSSGNLLLNTVADPTPPDPTDFAATLTSTPGSRTAEVTLDFARAPGSTHYEIQRSRAGTPFWHKLLGIEVAEASSSDRLVAHDTFHVETEAEWIYRLFPWIGRSRSQNAAEDSIRVLEPAIQEATLEILGGGPQPEVEVNTTYRVDLRSFIRSRDSSGSDIGLVSYEFVTNVQSLPIREERPRLTGTGLLEFTPTTTAPFSISIRATGATGASATFNIHITASDTEATITVAAKDQSIRSAFETTFTLSNGTVSPNDDETKPFVFNRGIDLLDTLVGDQFYQSASNAYKLYALRQFEYAPNPAMVNWIKGELRLAALINSSQVTPDNIAGRRVLVEALKQKASQVVIDNIDAAFRLIRPHSGFLQCRGDSGQIPNGIYKIEEGLIKDRTSNAVVGYIENNGLFRTEINGTVPSALSYDGSDFSVFAGLNVGVELIAWNDASTAAGNRTLRFGYAVPTNFHGNERIAPLLSERMVQLAVRSRRNGIDVRVSAGQGYRTPKAQGLLSSANTDAAPWVSYHQYGLGLDFSLMAGFPYADDPNNHHIMEKQHPEYDQSMKRVGMLSKAEQIEAHDSPNNREEVLDWSYEHVGAGDELHFNWPGLSSYLRTDAAHHLYYAPTKSTSFGKNGESLALRYYRQTNPEATTDVGLVTDQSIITDELGTWMASVKALQSVWEMVGATDRAGARANTLPLKPDQISSGAINSLDDVDHVQIDIDQTKLKFGQSLTVRLNGLSESLLRLFDPHGVDLKLYDSVPNNSSHAGGFAGFESSRFETDATIFFVPEVAGTYTLEIQGTGLNTGSYEVGYGRSSPPIGDDWRSNSNFLLGDVAVKVVFFDSDGTLDADLSDWTATEIAQAKSEITAGLGWWTDSLAIAESVHSLKFNLDFANADVPFETRIESSTRILADAGLAIDDFRDGQGFATSSRTNFFDRYFDVSEFNFAKRQTTGSDWATTIFVFKEDFIEGSAAWAEQGGPWIVLAGKDAIKKEIVAHELGHVFHALNEYAGGHDYDEISGVYGSQNVNAFEGNPSPGARVGSIMDDQFAAWNGHNISPSAAAMIGWRDTDSDGVFDVLDVPLSLQGHGNYDASLGSYTFEGTSSAVPFESMNPHPYNNTSVTLNTIDRVQYRIDAADWVTAEQFGTKTAEISFTVSGLAKEAKTIEVRTIDDDTGVTSKIIIVSLNDAPTDIDLSANFVAERQPDGTTVGVFTTSDPDPGNSFTYELVSGTGSIDNDSFSVDASGHLKTRAIFNFEAKSSYSIRVRSVDQGGLFVEQVFTISIDALPIANLLNPISGTTRTTDVGYVDVNWTDPGGLAAGIDPATIDVNDVSIVNDGRTLTINSVTDQGGGVWRYRYAEALHTAANGSALPVQVTFVAGQVKDLAGNANVVETESFLFDNKAPRVLSSVMNADQVNPTPAGPTTWVKQRSRIATYVVTFSEPVQSIAPANVQLVNLGVNAPATADITVTFLASQLSLNPEGTQLTLTFPASGTGSLADGVYLLRVLPTVTDGANALDGDGNGTGGDAYIVNGSATNKFFVLRGDWNGSGGVNLLDYGTFATYNLKVVGPTGAPAYVDLNNSGGVNLLDYGIFSSNYLKFVTFDAAAGSGAFGSSGSESGGSGSSASGSGGSGSGATGSVASPLYFPVTVGTQGLFPGSNRQDSQTTLLQMYVVSVSESKVVAATSQQTVKTTRPQETRSSSVISSFSAPPVNSSMPKDPTPPSLNLLNELAVNDDIEFPATMGWMAAVVQVPDDSQTATSPPESQQGDDQSFNGHRSLMNAFDPQIDGEETDAVFSESDELFDCLSA